MAAAYAAHQSASWSCLPAARSSPASRVRSLSRASPAHLTTWKASRADTRLRGAGTDHGVDPLLPHAHSLQPSGVGASGEPVNSVTEAPGAAVCARPAVAGKGRARTWAGRPLQLLPLPGRWGRPGRSARFDGRPVHTRRMVGNRLARAIAAGAGPPP